MFFNLVYPVMACISSSDTGAPTPWVCPPDGCCVAPLSSSCWSRLASSASSRSCCLQGTTSYKKHLKEDRNAGFISISSNLQFLTQSNDFLMICKLSADDSGIGQDMFRSCFSIRSNLRTSNLKT